MTNIISERLLYNYDGLSVIVQYILNKISDVILCMLIKKINKGDSKCEEKQSF